MTNQLLTNTTLLEFVRDRRRSGEELPPPVEELLADLRSAWRQFDRQAESAGANPTALLAVAFPLVVLRAYRLDVFESLEGPYAELVD